MITYFRFLYFLLQLTATTASVGMLNLALGQLGSLVPFLVSESDGHAVSLFLSLSTDSEKCGQFRTDAAKAKAAAEETKNCPDIRYASCALRVAAGWMGSRPSLPWSLTKQSFHCECINHIQANHISDRRGRKGGRASCPDSDGFPTQ